MQVRCLFKIGHLLRHGVCCESRTLYGVEDACDAAMRRDPQHVPDLGRVGGTWRTDVRWGTIASPRKYGKTKDGS
jgi:hypothetical protein